MNNELSPEMSLLLAKVTELLNAQTNTITENITAAILKQVDEKIKPIREENEKLKNEVEVLNKKILNLEMNSKRNNILIHGLPEASEEKHEDLINLVTSTLKGIEIEIESREIDRLQRLGKRGENDSKTRPILLTTTTLQKKIQILRNKKKMKPNTYITHDLPKQKLLLKKESKSTYTNRNEMEKRKRSETPSPGAEKSQLSTTNNQTKQHTTQIINKKYNKLKQINLPPRMVTAGESDRHPLTTNNRIYIATLNTRTLRTPESLLELEEALKDLHWDIIGISEMRRAGEAINEHLDYLIFNKGEMRGQGGVGFMIKIHLKNYIQDFHGVNDRIALLNIRIPNYKKMWTVIQVYAPTEQADYSEIESFYRTKQNNDEYVLGNFGYGKRSPNGQRLVDFLMEHNLTLLNSIFKKNVNNKWTWFSPDKKSRNEIDYIISNHPKLFTDTSVISKLNFNTDHRMVRAALKATPAKLPRKHIAPTRTTDHSDINQLTSHSLDRLRDELMASDSRDVKTSYAKLQKNLTNHKNKKLSKHKYTLSNPTLQLIHERKSLFNNKLRKQNTQKITELSKRIRNSIIKDRKTNRLHILEKHITRTGGTRRALKELREKTPWIINLKKNCNDNGRTSNRKEINKTATRFYSSLYSNQHAREQREQRERNSPISSITEPKILPSEVKKAILSQKPDKAPGPDEITNEILKGTLESVVPLLTKIYNDILLSGYIPEQWETSHIVLIYKKGLKEDIGNYRPISLMTNIYKVFSKIILDRISTTLDENQPMEQAGFRKNFSTIDHIHTVKQIVEKYNEFNKPLYMAFIDYTKAFDSISHEAIWDSLESQGIPTFYIKTIKSIYANSKARIKLESLGEPFKIERGVRQGDPLSPKLFSAVLENVFRKLDWEGYGLRIDGRKLNHLRFADDIVLFEENPSKLQKMIDELNNESNNVGLFMNIKKTKLMTNSENREIIINNLPLEYSLAYYQAMQSEDYMQVTVE
ncbi:unnamed protein product [Euphydryas editha]|uniref:Reverse transcriptase domain-containing protein n=1 Tax=Euphydryas editha TaxID=104508 RepID=A0AAU9TXL7_EUPED|nr:unnamed protein product [Euphydryas editha]